MLFGGNPGATGEERGERSSGGVWEAPAGQALSHPSAQALCSGPSASQPQRRSSQFLRPHQIFTLRLPQGIFWKTPSPPTPTSKEKSKTPKAGGLCGFFKVASGKGVWWEQSTEEDFAPGPLGIIDLPRRRGEASASVSRKMAGQAFTCVFTYLSLAFVPGCLYL